MEIKVYIKSKSTIQIRLVDRGQYPNRENVNECDCNRHREITLVEIYRSGSLRFFFCKNLLYDFPIVYNA